MSPLDCLYFYSNSTTAIADFVEAAKLFPDTVARVDSRGDGRYEVCLSTGRDARFQPGGQGNLAEVLPTRSGVYRYLERLGLLDKKATEKRVPPEIFELSDGCLELFLGRLWAGDGFIANRTNYVPYYATSSLGLAEDVVLLLLRLGILSVLKQKRFTYRGGVKLGYTLHIIGEGATERFLERLGPHCVSREDAVETLRAYVEATKRNRASKDTLPAQVRSWVDTARKENGLTWKALERASGVCVKELYGQGNAKKRGFRRATIQAIGEELQAAELIELASSDVFWDEVVSIEAKGVRETYDLTVEEDHNFIANGIIVHNSHSAAYALVTYHTAFLKTYYLVEFMASLLSTEANNTENIVKYIGEAKLLGAEVLPPTVNESDISFTVPDGKVRFGLGAVKGLGGAALEAILQVRKKGGAFSSLYDLCERVSLKTLNKKTLETMIKSGACDCFGHPRARLIEALPDAIEAAKSIQKAQAMGQGSLFGSPELAKAVKPREVYDEKILEWPELERLKLERKALGFYVSGHPMDRYQEDLARLANAKIANLGSLGGFKAEAQIGCMVTALRERPLRDGSGRMAFVTIEDTSGSIETMCSARNFPQIEQVLKAEVPLLVKAIVSTDRDPEGGERVRVRVVEAQTLAEARKERTRGIILSVEAEALENGRVEQLKSLIQESNEGVPVALTVRIPGVGEVDMRIPDAKLEASDEIVDRVEQLFGVGVARFV